MVGGNLAEMAASNGWAGIVIDGCVRDAIELSEASVGILARGTCPRRSVKRGLGERDVTVTMAGADLAPGMWLWADEDGMVLTAGPLG
jgi:regulator of ribonuclease activity A